MEYDPNLGEYEDDPKLDFYLGLCHLMLPWEDKPTSEALAGFAFGLIACFDGTSFVQFDRKIPKGVDCHEFLRYLKDYRASASTRCELRSEATR